MFEIYRQLGREHDAELQREAARRALARTVRRRPSHPVSVLIGAIFVLGIALALVLSACSLGDHGDAGTLSTVVGLNGSENRGLAPDAPDFT